MPLILFLFVRMQPDAYIEPIDYDAMVQTALSMTRIERSALSVDRQIGFGRFIRASDCGQND